MSNYYELADGVTLPIGTKLNKKYIIEDVLGIGGFGITYRGRCINNQSVCAIKELFINDSVLRMNDGKTVLPHENKKRLFNHGIRRFMEEASILNALNGTHNVVKIEDYFEENNTAYFVMEYVDGPTLSQLMAIRGGKIPFEEACSIISEIGKTLEYIHKEYRIFHRDLSPENIIIRADGTPVIIDFGNAKNYVRNSGESMSIVLKPGFAPPEQYTGKNQGPWTDVYSLAGIFYYITSSIKIPPAADRAAGVEYDPLYKLVYECGKDISDLVDRSLDINYAQRVKSTGTIARALALESESKPLLNDANIESVKRPYINVMDHIGNIEKWVLPNDISVIAGRDSSLCNIIIGTSNKISKQHFAVMYVTLNNKFEIVDISKNGLFLEGIRLKQASAVVINPGTKLMVGNDSYIEVGVE